MTFIANHTAPAAIAHTSRWFVFTPDALPDILPRGCISRSLIDWFISVHASV